MVGYTREELSKKPLREITHPYYLDHIERMPEGEIDGYGVEKRYAEKYGSIVWRIRESPS